MNDTLTFMPAGIAGLVLGAIFFGGLCWTVRKGMASPRPALWFFTSLMLRMAVVLLGFHWVGRDDWRRMVACLVGFVVARFAVIRLTRPPSGKQTRIEEEASHAP